MKFIVIAAASLLGLVSAAPASTEKLPPNGYGANFKFPLANKFPNPGAKAQVTIQKLAGGTLPNGPAPPNPGATGALDLMVIATNELTEVAFFTELLHNVTSGVAGYDVGSLDKSYVIDTLQAVKNQEQLHALSANAVLAAYGYTEVQPCAYTFPVTTFSDAIALAGTFTDLVLGALQSVEADLAASGNQALAQIVGSIIGQEGEQEGFYRFAQAKVPSSAPFLTNSNGIFAYNALLQLFIVPSSCPSTLTQIPRLGALSVTSTPAAENSTIAFSVTGNITSSNYITYMSGQDVPVTVPISNIQSSGGKTTFSADFPFEGGFSKGLTVAAVTKGKGPYANNTAVAMASSFGPGLIEVD